MASICYVAERITKRDQLEGASMKKVITALLVFLLLYSCSFAESLLRYPEKKKEGFEEAPLGMVIVGGFSFGWTIWAVYDAKKIDRISKKPLLSNEDIRKLKRARWLFRVRGVCQGVVGILTLALALNDSNKKNDPLWYGASISNFVGATMWLSNGSKADRVLSRHNIP